MQMIERFRNQLSLIDLQFEGDPDLIRTAVWSCYQENPTKFRGYSLYDPGAYPEPPLEGKLTWRVTQPWVDAVAEEEREAKERAQQMIDRLKARGKTRRPSKP